MKTERLPDGVREKRYAAPFELSGKRIILVGLGFSSEPRMVTDNAIDASAELRTLTPDFS